MKSNLKGSLLKVERLYELARTPDEINKIVSMLREMQVSFGNSVELAMWVVFCFRHKFQLWNDKLSLNQFEKSVEDGLRIKASESELAIFHLLLGEVRLYHAKMESRYPVKRVLIQDAVDRMYHAYKQVHATNDVRKYKFQALLAKALLANKQYDEALSIVNEALCGLEKKREIPARKFREKTLLCRTLLTASKAAFYNVQPLSALWDFLRGYKLAWSLKLHHASNFCLQEYHLPVLRKLGFLQHESFSKNEIS